MKRYPLIFGFRDLVQGEGYLAGVAVDGRALLNEQSDDDFWVEGIQPGGFSAVGASAAEALEEFRRVYTLALYDVAGEAASFEDFRREVQHFFDEGNEVALADWQRAVEAVRRGELAFARSMP